jgi:hypothetical protein
VHFDSCFKMLRTWWWFSCEPFFLNFYLLEVLFWYAQVRIQHHCSFSTTTSFQAYFSILVLDIAIFSFLYSLSLRSNNNHLVFGWSWWCCWYCRFFMGL